MFDPETIRIISEAPSLDGLDQGEISKILTEAYAQIVSARLRLRELQEAGGDTEELIKNVDILRRLASTQEALVAALGERDNRQSAAFVGASAHHAEILYKNFLAPSEDTAHQLNPDFISAEVAATVLFLIAEATADASEISRYIKDDGSLPIENSVLSAIKLLANGDVRQLIDLEGPSLDEIKFGISDQSAASALYLTIFKSLKGIAASLLSGEPRGALDGATPQALLDQVIELGASVLSTSAGDRPRQVSMYAGPVHLAKLLKCAYRDLEEISVLNTKPPEGVSQDKWGEFLSSLSERRPFLWRNHRAAVESGYLNIGTSSVISFPTGAGKSTLSEMKIATTLISGKKVIFLAPTLALVDQTTNSLKQSFPDLEVFKEAYSEQTFDEEVQELKDLSVLTPESCLALVSFSPDLFSNVGLVVFDECHLLHPREAEKSRRAIDAMLCLLNLNSLAPDSDFLLLSAMLQNTAEISEWIENLTDGRKCLPLDLLWKPTRQVRGCVVYGEDEISLLKSEIKRVRSASENKAPPASLKRSLTASPFGFFCLHQTWRSNDRGDYSLIPLLEEKVKLSAASILPDELKETPKQAANKDYRWYLTPSGLQVSADLASASAQKGLKSIIFVQTIPNAISTDKAVNERIQSQELTLEDSEKVLLDLISLELGADSASYIKLNSGFEFLGPKRDKKKKYFANSSVCHHGHLLPLERNLHEAIFKRPDGVNVMVATSTISQGMNLPADIVLIGGDSRFDIDAEKMEQLAAHELLNAAGRAGRAGERSHGFVLVVPSKVIHFNNDTNRIHKHWSELRAIFSQSDQCVEVTDPLLPIVDYIHDNSSSDTVMADYLIGRLQFSSDTDRPGALTVDKLLHRSLAAYHARKAGNETWAQDRAEALRIVSERRVPSAEWKEKVAASAGVPVDIVSSLAELLDVALREEATTKEWFDWFSQWLNENPTYLLTLIREEPLSNFMGTLYKSTNSNTARARMAYDKLIPLTIMWMEGKSLSEIELAYGTADHLIKTCEKAREFGLRVIPELAYIMSLPNIVLKAMLKSRNLPETTPLGLETLGSCVRTGFDRIEKLALDIISEEPKVRRSVHEEFKKIESYVSPFHKGQAMKDVISDVDSARVLSQLL